MKNKLNQCIADVIWDGTTADEEEFRKKSLQMKNKQESEIEINCDAYTHKRGSLPRCFLSALSLTRENVESVQ